MVTPRAPSSNTNLRLNGNNDHFNMTPQRTSGRNALMLGVAEEGGKLLQAGVNWYNSTSNTKDRGTALDRYNAAKLGRTSDGVHMHNRMHADMGYAHEMQVLQEKQNVQRGLGGILGPVGGLIGAFVSARRKPTAQEPDYRTARTVNGTPINPGDKSLRGKDLRNPTTMSDTANSKNLNNPLAIDTLSWLKSQPRSTGTQTDNIQSRSVGVQAPNINKSVLVKDASTQGEQGTSYPNSLRASRPEDVQKSNKLSGEFTTQAQVHTLNKQKADTHEATSKATQAKPMGVVGNDEITVDNPMK